MTYHDCVFNRPGNPWASAVRTLCNADETYNRAIGRNMACDDRISEDRAREINRFNPSAEFTPQGLEQAIKQYFYDRVRTAGFPDYLRPELNENNFAESVHPKWDLVRLVNLTGLPLFKWAQDHGAGRLAEFTDIADSRGIPALLEASLRGQTKEQQRPFVEAVIEAMNVLRHVTRFQPVWTTAWACFEPYLSQPPHRWLELFGIGRTKDKPWIMVLRYPRNRVWRLVRPTQLDAEWNALHFPSLGQTDPNRGGHPMDLGGKADNLRNEFIHEMIDHELNDWLRAELPCLSPEDPPPSDLAVERRAHYQLLCEPVAYGAQRVAAWMPDPI